MKDILIIFAHPDNKTSLNALILENLIKGLEQNNKTYSVIDLYAENFNPIFNLEELREGFLDDTILAQHKLMNEHKTLVFITPGWNYGTPAILKGWVDRVLVIPGYSFEEDEKHRYIRGLLFDKNAYIIQTIGGYFNDDDVSKTYYYEPLKQILHYIGIKDVKIHMFDRLYSINKKKLEVLSNTSYQIGIKI